VKVIASGASGLARRTPLHTWTRSDAGTARLRRRLGRAPFVLAPCDTEWRRLAPGWDGCLALARAGLPFHIVAGRRYDRAGDRRRLGAALAEGATVYLPQVHEALPRVARLMVAIRAGLLGAGREESSFLFVVDGRSREGMGLHHDGDASAFWIQLEGRRTVTIGPPVRPGTRQDLPDAMLEHGPRWRTIDLDPGTLFHLPPYTPHRVLCRGRSRALSLTWTRPRRRLTERARLVSLAAWPVASGRATAVPPASRDRLWTQVPGIVERGTLGVRLWTPSGRIDLPATARPLANRLAEMPALPRGVLRGRHSRAVSTLLEHGVLGARDLPAAIVPAHPAALEGWRFA